MSERFCSCLRSPLSRESLVQSRVTLSINREQASLSLSCLCHCRVSFNGTFPASYSTSARHLQACELQSQIHASAVCSPVVRRHTLGACDSLAFRIHIGFFFVIVFSAHPQRCRHRLFTILSPSIRSDKHRCETRPAKRRQCPSLSSSIFNPSSSFRKRLPTLSASYLLGHIFFA